MIGSEVFVSKCISYRIVDLTELIARNCKFELIVLRKHEKAHEKLIGEKEFETFRTLNSVFSKKWFVN